MLFCTTYPSPLGELLLVSDGTALTGLWLDSQQIPGLEAVHQDSLPIFAAAREWLDSYFLGKPVPLSFPLAPAGTPFRKQVWKRLLEIPYGQTVSYGEIAREISPTMSAQAVGQAVGANPISIIIPCHRCIGARGALTGYAGGLDKKQWLLRHEEVTK